MDFKQHLQCFSKLLDDRHIAEFLKNDRCGALCDKYHLIIVFQFFMRAEFKEEDYTYRNFFLALTLSHDLYDESKFLKHIILSYYLSCCDGLRHNTKVTFHWDKLSLFNQMQYKGFVERKICKKLFQLVSHKAFDRNRREPHTGYITNKSICDKCRCPTNVNISQTNQENNSTSKSSDQANENIDKNKISRCNLDVPALLTEQKAKKPKRNTISKAKNLFFRGCEKELFAVEKQSVTFTY